MNTRECIVYCVGILSVVFLLVVSILAMYFVDRLSELTEVLSQPGVTSNITIERLIIRPPDSITYIEMEGFDAQVNSRILDLLLNLAVDKQTHNKIKVGRV